MRQAHVIGVHVRDHHAQNGQAFHGARHHLAPGFLRARIGHAAVHHGPAVSHACGRFFCIRQQPQIDVVQRKRQGHANPPHPRRDFQSVSQLWQGGAQWKTQGFFASHEVGRVHLGARRGSLSHGNSGFGKNPVDN